MTVPLILSPAARDEYMLASQMMLDGLLAGDLRITKIARKMLHDVTEQADAQLLHAMLTGIFSITDIQIANRDLKEGTQR